MKVAKQSASPEPGEVARRGKAAATEGLFSFALIGLHLSTKTGHKDESFKTWKIVKLIRITATLDNAVRIAGQAVPTAKDS